MSDLPNAHTRVIVVGAGIGGLTAGIALHRLGFKVTLYESAEELKALGVGINLLPHSVRLLWDLGCRDALETDAIKTSTLRYHAKDGKTIWQEPRGRDAGYQWPQYSLLRGHLQTVLLNKLRGLIGSESIITASRCVGVDQTDARVTAHFVHPTSGATLPDATADCLIAADGLMSAVRAQFYPDEGNPVYAGQVLWRAVSEWPGFFDQRTMIMMGNNQLKTVIYPVSDNTGSAHTQLVNWIAERSIDKELPENKGDWNKLARLNDFAPYFDHWRFEWLDVPALFAAADTIYEFPMVDRDPVAQWSFGRVTLLGDAAHPMRPNGSNGASQAIIDAVTVAAELDAIKDVPRALASYEKARLEPTANITLSNRTTGPERILDLVEARCPNGFDRLEDHVSPAELDEIAESYKKIAGFSRDQLNLRRPGT